MYFTYRKNRNYALLIFTLTIVISFISIPFNLSFNQNANSSYSSNNIEENNQLDYPITQDLSLENQYSGIGTEWNVTHYANRTDVNLPVSFINGSYGLANIPLGGVWEGYKIETEIHDLYDTRNWCNGTFEFGGDDNDDSAGDDDSTDPRISQNQFQNWTFHTTDIESPPAPGWANFTNPMSGNYLDNTYVNTSNHNCIELRIDAKDVYGDESEWGYNEGDKCWWSTLFTIDRGKVIDSELQFDVKVNQAMDQNALRLAFHLNNEKLYSINSYTLKQQCGGAWKTYRIPQRIWENISNIFSNPVNTSALILNISLEYSSYHTQWAGSYSVRYQQIFIDNVKLITMAEARPSQINLKMNNTEVNDLNWGKGSVKIEGNWKNPKVYANYSSYDTWGLGDYNVSLSSDLNLFAIKNTPDTTYETNFESNGTYFSVDNESIVNWEAYVDFAVLNGYIENEMRLSFPADLNITGIYEPQDPNTNRLKECDNLTSGLLIIPVSNISSTPNGYWTFKGISPNYCENIGIYNNNTGSWIANNTFLSGEYINITAKIIDSPIINGYKESTKAYLSIRFPNGSIWDAQSKYKSPDSNGNIFFDIIQVPNAPPYYEVGEYEVIITWNNSYSSFNLNEAGIISSRFYIIHESKLEPDQGIYYYEKVIDNGIKNIKVTFNDKNDDTAIENAQVYTYFNAKMLNFSEISPGFYLLEFNATEAQAGNNTLSIYANSTYYLNNQINITLDVFKETVLSLNTTFISCKWNQNFTFEFNYTEKNTGNGINTLPQYNWIGPSYIIQTAIGEYSLTCNTSYYKVNQLHSIILNLDEDSYESQTALINIQLLERDTHLEVYVNGTRSSDFIFYNLSIGMDVNFTVIYTDNLTVENIKLSTVKLIGSNFSKQFFIHPIFNQYNLTLSAEELGLGAKFLTVSAQKSNYTSLSEAVNLVINKRASNIELFINGTITNENEKYLAQVGEYINITVTFKDLLNNTHLTNANITLLGQGGLTENNPLEYYNIIIYTNDLDQKINIFTLLAQKNGYEVNTFPFIIEIVDRNTELKVFVNGIETQFIDIPIGKDVNITIKYLDNQTKTHIINATVQLFGEGFNFNLTENSTLEQYTYIIDKDALDIKDWFLTIYSNKLYYQPHSPTLKITIRKIKIELETGLEENTLNIHPGSSYTLKITLINKDFGGTVKNARLIYTWAFGQGELTDLDNDGIYETNFENIPEGVFTVSITIYAGANYEFKRYEFTINSVRPAEEALLIQILIICAISASLALTSYLIAYQKVLKYPKPVRKIRKYKNNIKSKKILEKIEIINREESFMMLYAKHLGKIGKELNTSIKEKETISVKQPLRPLIKDPAKKGGDGSL